ATGLCRRGRAFAAATARRPPGRSPPGAACPRTPAPAAAASRRSAPSGPSGPPGRSPPPPPTLPAPPPPRPPPPSADAGSRLAHHVAHAADRVDQFACPDLLQLPAQVAHVHPQRVRGRAEVIAPNAVVDHAMRQHLARVAQEQLQQLVLRAG